MYEILRVPPGPGHMKKAYSIFLSFVGSTRIMWDDFYNTNKSVYMVSTKCGYHGMGWIRIKNMPNYMSHLVKIRPTDNTVYEMNITIFDNDDVYLKAYELIKTLIRDCTDKMIIIENISNQSKEVINALKNNGFKVFNDSSAQYTGTYYKILKEMANEYKFKPINPKDDLHAIDKHICLCDEYDKTKELQDKMIADKLAENIKFMKNQKFNICPYCGCIECNCNQNGQTSEDFLGKDTCYCKGDFEC